MIDMPLSGSGVGITWPSTTALDLLGYRLYVPKPWRGKQGAAAVSAPRQPTDLGASTFKPGLNQKPAAYRLQ